MPARRSVRSSSRRFARCGGALRAAWTTSPLAIDPGMCSELGGVLTTGFFSINTKIIRGERSSAAPLLRLLHLSIQARPGLRRARIDEMPRDQPSFARTDRDGERASASCESMRYAARAVPALWRSTHGHRVARSRRAVSHPTPHRPASLTASPARRSGRGGGAHAPPPLARPGLEGPRGLSPPSLASSCLCARVCSRFSVGAGRACAAASRSGPGIQHPSQCRRAARRRKLRRASHGLARIPCSVRSRPFCSTAVKAVRARFVPRLQSWNARSRELADLDGQALTAVPPEAMNAQSFAAKVFVAAAIRRYRLNLSSKTNRTSWQQETWTLTSYENDITRNDHLVKSQYQSLQKRTT